MRGLEQLQYNKIEKNYHKAPLKKFDVTGILIKNKDNSVSIDMGDRIVDAKLKNPLKEPIGAKVTIPKSEIIDMKIHKKEEPIEINKSYYEKILQSYGLPVDENSIRTIKNLEAHGMKTSKENIQTITVGKQYLDTIEKNLNYDHAVKLVEQDIDLRNDSIDKIAKAVESIKKDEKKSVSFLKMIGLKKDLTTDDAEKIAKEIYGSKMGKDITDIIKSLHKEKINITKENIEKVHRTFYKLGKLKDVDDTVFVEAVKEQKTMSIDQLYNSKYSMKKGKIEVSEGVSDFVSKAYEESGIDAKTITEKDLSRVEKDIISRLEALDITPSKENIAMAKELIIAKVDINGSNINEVIDMKKALKDILHNLDGDKASALMDLGIDLEKDDIRYMVDSLKDIDHVVPKEIGDKVKIEEIQTRLETLKEIKVSDLIKLLKNDADFDLKNVERVIFNKKSVKVTEVSKPDIETFKNTQTDFNVKKGIERIFDVSRIFDKIKSLNPNYIDFHLSKGVSMTLGTVEKVHDQWKKENNHRSDIDKKEMNKNIINEITNQYNRVRQKLSASMVLDCMRKRKDVLHMPIDKMDEEILKSKKETVNGLIQTIKNIGKEKETIIPLLLKNEMKFSLDEIQNVSMFLKNVEQFGHKISSCIKFMNQGMANVWEMQFKKLDKLSKAVSEKLKNGDSTVEDSYKDLIQHVGNMKQDMEFSQENNKESNEYVKALIDALEMQKKLNKNMNLMQFPVLMGDEIKNLQIYVNDADGISKKDRDEATTIFINLDTRKLGQVGMKLNMKNDAVAVEVGVEGLEARERLEKYVPFLRDEMKKIGYKLEGIDFSVRETPNLLNEISNKDNGLNNAILDMKI
ncbi:flagellar hook-length control protein FliK [Lutibacter sp. B2]|nr:flagellar hook-length control protein FliK [Lutibacter sp. B2]